MRMLLEIGLSNALMATLLAIPAALATRYCRRPVLAHTLWLLVLLKLVTPPLFKVTAPDPTALVDATVQASSRRPFPPEPEKRTRPAEELAALERDRAECATEPPSTGCDTAPAETEIIAAPEPLIMLTPLAPGAAEPPAPGPAGAPAAVDISAALSAPITDWATIAWMTWLAGAIGCLVLAGARIGAFHRLLRYATPAPLDLQEQAERLAKQLGLGRCPRVWVVPGAVSPLVWAVAGRARIVVPRHLIERLGPQERETMLAHELAHVRRHDHWVRWLEFVVLAIFWWHPVAWLARWQIQQLEEQCCDGWVVATLPNAAREYARALVKTVHFLAEARPALPPAASGLGYVHLLKRRLDMILTQSLSHRLPWPVQVAAVLFGLMVLPVAPQRLAAKAAAPDDPPEARAADENEESSSSSNRRDLEKRMSSLEKKMDRLLRALERSSSSRSSSRSSESADEDKKRSDRDSERAEIKRKTKELKEATKSARGRSWNPDEMKDFEVQMKDLDKRIRAAVEKAVNPERMKEMERQIEEAVNKSVNPERMEEMSRQIEQAVHQAVNPERIEALVRRIESTVKRGLEVERHREMAEQQLKKSHEAAEMAREKAERARADAEREEAQRTRSDSERRARSRSRSSSRGDDTSDLERRMSRLEERMNRVLEALEAQRRPPK